MWTFRAEDAEDAEDAVQDDVTCLSRFLQKTRYAQVNKVLGTEYISGFVVFKTPQTLAAAQKVAPKATWTAAKCKPECFGIFDRTCLLYFADKRQHKVSILWLLRLSKMMLGVQVLLWHLLLLVCLC